MKDLRSECVAKCYGFYFQEEYPRVVMEYCNMGNLSEYLKENGSLCEDPVVRMKILRNVAKGVKVLHDSEIFRDLKPINIMLHRDPSDGKIRIKIADFDTLVLHTGLRFSAQCTTVPFSPERLARPPTHPQRFSAIRWSTQ